MSPIDSSSSHVSGASDKQAACLECRRSKIKCIREAGAEECRKCRQGGLTCVRPEYHVGRYKGVKNKRTGLEKAIYQVEQAIKRSKGNGVSFDVEPNIDLRQLITKSPNEAAERKLNSDITAEQTPHLPLNEVTSETQTKDHYTPVNGFTSEKIDRVDELALNNADNPLQLLAMASALPNQSPSTILTPSPGGPLSQVGSSLDPEDAELQQFFGYLPTSLDNTPDIDPIEQGLITLEEATSLFKYFYDNLSHTRWGLDPHLHTTSFVRSRSAFLFTSVLAAAATFLPHTVALARRLSLHRTHLAQNVIAKRYRSVEIVLAFLVNIPWMSPNKHWADDETCTYLSMALTLALDLSLNKIVVPSPTIRPAGFLDRIAKSDCIDATKALRLDGFSQADPTSVLGRRLLRTRERAWLALWVLDRGVCLARGRPYAVPSSPLVDSCDSWHISDIADRWDGSIISATVLRRDLVSLIASVRETCDNNQLNVAGGSAEVKYLKDKIDRFFDQWYNVWSYQINQGDGKLPPYVEILVSHTKLSTYCSVINHPTASSDVKKFFRAAGLAAAWNVMRAAVQGESRLMSMPNNTVIMVSFAACFALGLSTTSSGQKSTLAPNARALIEEVAQVLERIGTTPKHRNGSSALYGRHIRRIIRTSFPNTMEETQVSQPGINVQNPDLQLNHIDLSTSDNTIRLDHVQSRDPYTFDMTDDQIIEAINNASASQELFQLEETMFLDWLDWPNPTGTH